MEGPKLKTKIIDFGLRVASLKLDLDVKDKLNREFYNIFNSFSLFRDKYLSLTFEKLYILLPLPLLHMTDFSLPYY